MADQLSVGLIGAGAMGGALMKGWLDRGVIDNARSAVFDPGIGEDMVALCKANGLSVNPPIDAIGVDALVIAIKPQMMGDALPAYAPLAEGAVILSVMAGKSVAAISRALGGAQRIVRAMPNLPAAIGKGVCGLYADEGVGEVDRARVTRLIEAAGAAVWVDREQAIDFVTAVSGSGPAYFFLLTEALAEAGVELGLPKGAAAQLALETFCGSAALMASEARSPAQMRQAVTSPGGTTAAALSVLDGDDKALRDLLQRAVRAAAERAKDLTD